MPSALNNSFPGWRIPTLPDGTAERRPLLSRPARGNAAVFALAAVCWLLVATGAVARGANATPASKVSHSWRSSSRGIDTASALLRFADPPGSRGAAIRRSNTWFAPATELCGLKPSTGRTRRPRVHSKLYAPRLALEPFRVTAFRHAPRPAQHLLVFGRSPPLS